MQLIVMLVIALLIGPPTAAGAGASNCGQATEFAAARRPLGGSPPEPRRHYQ